MSTVTPSTGRPPVFKTGPYRLRITGQPTLAESKNKNMYLNFTLECIGYYDAATQQVLSELDGQEIAGWEFNYVATFLPDGRNIGLEQIHRAVIGGPLEPPSELDEKTMIPVGVNYTDLEIYAICESEEKVSTDKRTGKPAVNPLTGKPVVSYRRRIVSILTAD